MIAEERALSFNHTLDGTNTRSLIVLDTAHGYKPLIEEPLGHEFGYHDLQERVRVVAQDFFNAFPAPEVIPVNEQFYDLAQNPAAIK